MPEYEESRARLAQLADFYRAHPGDRNEATTRLQLIDRLFLECLGWSRQDVASEVSHEGAYADYTFSAPRPILIVEAKREGKTFELPIGASGAEQRLPGLLRDNPDLRLAVQQAARYCHERGVNFGVIANGHQLVAFIPVRHDGTHR